MATDAGLSGGTEGEIERQARRGHLQGGQPPDQQVRASRRSFRATLTSAGGAPGAPDNWALRAASMGETARLGGRATRGVQRPECLAILAILAKIR